MYELCSAAPEKQVPINSMTAPGMVTCALNPRGVAKLVVAAVVSSQFLTLPNVPEREKIVRFVTTNVRRVRVVQVPGDRHQVKTLGTAVSSPFVFDEAELIIWLPNSPWHFIEVKTSLFRPNQLALVFSKEVGSLPNIPNGKYPNAENF